MTMTRRGIKVVSLLMAALFVVCALPQASLAELPEYLEVTNKDFANEAATPPALEPGQVWVTRTATSPVGNSPEATVTLSALGREYTVTEEKTRKFNIMFVLDVSNSMLDNNKANNMAVAANSAVQTLCVNGNKVGVVTFGTDASVRRGLSTTGFTLTTTQTTSGNRINVKPSNGSDGGTNIQAGLTAAYYELSRNAAEDVVPVIILLSDGAPTFYYDEIDAIPTGSSYTAKNDGSGTETTNKKIAMTIMQAAYLKTIMAGLGIYTISFDINSNESRATLNPTTTNISSVGNLLNDLNTIKATTKYVSNASVREKLIYSYADGAYTASNSTDSLSAALINIVRDIKVVKPVAESPRSQGSAELAETSYVKITDQVGTGYALGSTATITLAGTPYTFNYNSSQNAFAYSGASNAQMSKIVLTYNNSTRELVWKIPGSVLPCVSTSGTASAPIQLSYTVALSGSDLEEGVYSTSANCKVWFTPASDNPYYDFSVNVANSAEGPYNMLETTTTKYQATYAGSGATTTLLRYGTSVNDGAYAYKTGSDLSGMSAYFDGTKLNAGGFNFAQGEQRTASFTVSFRYYPSSGAYSSFNVGAFAVNGKATSSRSIASINGRGDNWASMSINYSLDGAARSLDLNNLPMTRTFTNYSGTSNDYYTYTGTGSFDYWVATTDESVARELYEYTASPQTLTLNIPNKSAVTLTEGTSGDVTTVILPGENNSYTVTQTTQTNGFVSKVVTYTLVSNVLNIQTATYTKSTTTKATQSYNLEASGSITLASSNLISDVTLKSGKGSGTAVGEVVNVNNAKDYRATVILTFTAKAKFNNLAFSLTTGKSAGSQAALANYTVVGMSQGLTQGTGGTYSADEAGTYFIMLQFMNPYTPEVPDSFYVYFAGLTYATLANNQKQVEPESGYAGQKVKVVLSSPNRH
ncbi:MAG TPA: vWA domain-containing protein [Clostridia bacterium]|nr:vWA domain-containing protein [Clostridia bacterium]